MLWRTLRLAGYQDPVSTVFIVHKCHDLSTANVQYETIYQTHAAKLLKLMWGNRISDIFSYRISVRNLLAFLHMHPTLIIDHIWWLMTSLLICSVCERINFPFNLIVSVTKPGIRIELQISKQSFESLMSLNAYASICPSI